MGYVPVAGMPAANRPSSWQLSSPQQAPRPASGPETQGWSILIGLSVAIASITVAFLLCLCYRFWRMQKQQQRLPQAQVMTPTRESCATHSEITVAVAEGFWVEHPDGKIDVAHAVMIGTAGSTPCQPEHGDGCTSHPAGSSTAGIGHCPTALAVHGGCDHSQAGISAALPGAKSAADLLPNAVQMHGLGAAEQEGPSRVL